MQTLAEMASLLEQERQRLRLTYEELGDAAGLSRVATTSVVQGRAAPKLTTLMALAGKLGLELVLVPKQVAAGLQPDRDAGAPRPMSRVEQLMNAAAAVDSVRTQGSWSLSTQVRGAQPGAIESPPLRKRVNSIRKKPE